ncbi:MAG TPA: sulfotransferase, partial [Bacteroidia bacterium]|nr:sulfotransferase [Bacteroidia bacterium]
MLPNFLIAGVAKAGTTSLYYYLTQHPEVDIPRKESFYFAREFYKNAPGDKPPFYRDKSRIVFTEKDYDKFYSHVNKNATGEVSTCYAYFHESAVPLIKEKLGDVKIIFILRNPVERAYSAYKHFLRAGAETLSFKEALDAEKSRIEKRWDFMWHYAAVGFYAKQVKAFRENFSHVKIFLSDDLDAKPGEVMKVIFQFIGVNDGFIPDTSFRYNSADAKPAALFDYLSEKKFSKKFLKPIIRKIIPEKKRMAIK